MSYIKGVVTPDLGTGGAFALWSFRTIASGCRNCIEIREGFEKAFGAMGEFALEDMILFVNSIGAAKGRRLFLAPPGCCRVTADELSVIAALSCAQSLDIDGCNAHIDWLIGRTVSRSSLTAAVRASQRFQQAGLEIKQPTVTLTPPSKPLDAPVYHAAGHA